VFNPQTGEYVEVAVSAQQLALEAAEKDPVPQFRGRFKIGPDGRLSSQPEPEVSANVETFPVREVASEDAFSVFDAAPDQHGPFEIIDL